MPQSWSGAKHSVRIIVQRGLTQTTSPRAWILRRVRFDERPDPLPWDRPASDDPW
jgi:hypothetical protein